MLKRLKLKNIGLIDDLSIEFNSGLNILTGETGAGKSMILSALQLILGERADYSILKNHEKNGSAEAVFENAEDTALPILDFEKEGIEPEDGAFIIRRLLQKEGKSRAFVNGSSIILSTLKNGGEKMVDIHGQHEHQALLKKETHLRWLDGYLSLEDEASKVSAIFTELKKKKEEINLLNEKQKEAAVKKEFLEFKLSELEKAELKEKEEGELEAEQKILANAEKIKEAGGEVFTKLYESDNSAISRIEEAAGKMERLKETDPFFEKYAGIFSGAASAVSDAAMEIQSYCSSLENDSQRLETVEERQSLIEKLKRKYGASLAGLIKMAEEAKTELSLIESADAKKEILENEFESIKKNLTEMAGKLHEKRIDGVKEFKQAVETELKGLNMENAKFEIEVTLADATDGLMLNKKQTKIFQRGFGDFRFLISTNEGQKPMPLTKVASGGEISRVMLGLKCATGKVQPVPVLVFDEIDSGIGGKTADLVGEKLKKLSKNCQILCITHLPQIARQADHHYVVKKESSRNNTIVSISLLDSEERVEELARMQAGKEITHAARQHAREMIGD